MVIADLDKSGWSVFSWAVIADLSFESLRFARWVFSHLSPLCSRLWSGQSHQATFICSSHLFTKNTKKAILFFCWQNIDNQCSVWIHLSLSSLADSWLLILYCRRHDHMSMWWIWKGRHYQPLPDIASNCGRTFELLFSCFRWLLIQYKERRPHVCLTNANVGSGHYRTLPDIGSNGGNDR